MAAFGIVIPAVREQLYLRYERSFGERSSKPMSLGTVEHKLAYEQWAGKSS